MNNLIGSHYLSLPSQGNIHLSALFKKLDGTIKIFVASLRRKVYLIEYQSFDNYIEPVTKEVYFAYISAGFEIIALDVFNRSKEINDLIIGIIIMKNSEGNNTHLNLYSEYDLEPNMNFSLETIGQSCESFVLEYIPYGLYHVQISPRQVFGSYENIWLIPGSDKKIHAYRGYYLERCHREILVSEFFPEFADIPNIILSIQVLYYNDYHNRISCLGCENGTVHCAIFNCDSNNILRNLHVEFENPISNVKLFSLNLPAVQLNEFVKNEDACELKENPKINLLVTNTIYHSEVFMDVLNFNLEKRHCLIESSQSDVCLCSMVADIDFDGNKEIIIGTYGEELLLFKYTNDERWQFVDRKVVPNPVYTLFYEDMTEDGLCELIIITSKGLHVYQHKIKQDTLGKLHSLIKNIPEDVKSPENISI